MADKGFYCKLDEEMIHKLHVIADYEGRSATGQIKVLIRECIERFEEKHGKIELGK